MKIEKVRFSYPNGDTNTYKVGSWFPYNSSAKEGQKVIQAIEISPTGEIILLLSDGFVVVAGATPYMLFSPPDEKIINIRRN